MKVNELALHSDIVYVWIIIWRRLGNMKNQTAPTHRRFAPLFFLLFTFTHSPHWIYLEALSQSPCRQPWKNCINSLGIHVPNLPFLLVVRSSAHSAGVCTHQRVEYCRFRLFCYFRLLWRFIYLFSLFPCWLLVDCVVFAFTPFLFAHFCSSHQASILLCMRPHITLSPLRNFHFPFRSFRAIAFCVIFSFDSQ